MSNPSPPRDTGVIEDILKHLQTTEQASGSLDCPTTPKCRAPTHDADYSTEASISKIVTGAYDPAAEDEQPYASRHSIRPNHARVHSLQSKSLTAPSAAASSTASEFSTPTRSRSHKTTCTAESVDDEILEDLQLRTHSDIKPADFLRIAFGLIEVQYSELSERIRKMEFDDRDDYKDCLQRIKRAAGMKVAGDSAGAQTRSKPGAPKKCEKDMYDALVDMGNMILEEAEKAEKEPSENCRKVRLWYLKEKHLAKARANRKPDIVLIPKDVRDRVVKEEKEAHKKAQEESATRNQAQGEEGSRRKFQTQRTARDAKADPEHSRNTSGNDEEGSETKKKESTLGKVNVREVLTVFELKTGGFGKVVSNASAGPNSSATATSGTQESAGVQQSTSKATSAISSGQQPRSGSKRKADAQSLTNSNKRPRSGREALDTPDGEDLKKRNDTTGRTQLARYAAELLSVRGDRKYVFGARLNADRMTFSLYHRSAIVEADSFKIGDEPGLFALFLLMFQREPTSYGFNEAMGYCDPFDIHAKKTTGQSAKIINTDVLKKGTQVNHLDFDNLKWIEDRSSEYCLIGRGSAVLKAEAPRKDGSMEELVIKYSWQEASRKDEAEYILEASKAIPGHVPKLFSYTQLDDTTPLDSLMANCANKGAYKEKKLRIIVMRYYKGLDEIIKPEEFWNLIIQCVKCLHILYILIKLLHRDISIGNLAFELVDGKLIIIILDFDLASYVGTTDHKNEIRTGTAPFMAREVLVGFKERYKHALHHDLESVFYVLIWHAAGYRGSELPKDDSDPLKDWRKGKYSSIRRAKDSFMECDDDAFENLPIQDGMLLYRLQELHRKYHHQTKSVARNQSDRSLHMDKVLDAVRRQAKQEGQTFEEINRRIKEKRNELRSDPLFDKPTIAISFKKWMEAAEEALEDEHLECTCCEKNQNHSV